MNPALKYGLYRLALFIVIAVPLYVFLPGANLFLILMAAVVVSALLSFFLLKEVRADLEHKLAEGVQRRREEKERLRAALAGDEEKAS